MISLFSYLLTFLAVMFWIFRAVVVFCSTIGVEVLGTVPLDANIEIGLLFVSLFALIFIVRRNMLGPFIYLVSYGIYFGIDLYTTIVRIQVDGAVLTDYTVFLNSFIAMLLAVLIFIDVLINKNRKGMVKDKNTDWFYTSKEFDRKLDERADRNQYKF